MKNSKKEFFLVRWLKRGFLGQKQELSLQEEEQVQTPLKTMINHFTHKKLAMFDLIVFLCIFLFVLIGPKFWVLDLSE